jgi:hypothetical protein
MFINCSSLQWRSKKLYVYVGLSELCIYTMQLHGHSFCYSKDPIVLLFRNRLLPINHVVEHYSDTGNVFQVFWSFNWEPVHQKPIRASSNKSINIIKYKIFTWFLDYPRDFEGLLQSKSLNQDIPYQFLRTGSRRARQRVVLYQPDQE